MEIGLLGSGSRGNSVLVRSAGSALLIDAGMSAKQITARLDLMGVSPSELLGIVLTHEHSDHIQGVGPLARRWGLPVWTNRATLEAGKDTLGVLPNWVPIEIGVPFEIGDVWLEPLSIPHDAADPFGLILKSSRGYRVGLATDMGFPTQLVRTRLRGLQGLVLEFNHDLPMLMDRPYPWPVKQRIRGKLGHLSNADAAELLGEVASPDLEWVVCAHMSQENNEEEIILKEARGALSGAASLLSRASSVLLHVASQLEPTPIFGPEGAKAPWTLNGGGAA
ncbi:MAG: MBL fold metallo-hydrolase [bacterium]